MFITTQTVFKLVEWNSKLNKEKQLQIQIHDVVNELTCTNEHRRHDQISYNQRKI